MAGVALFNVFTGSTLLLSYIRVCAVWNRSMPIVLVFGCLWLVALAGSLTTVGGITQLSIGSICVEVTAKNYVSAAVIAPTVNHVIVFAMITYGLCRHGSRDPLLDLRRGYKLYVLGDTLPAFSKALLQTSQMCYLYVLCLLLGAVLMRMFNSVVVLTGILTVCWFFGYASDPGYRIAIFSPYTTIVNIMFSWVFRKAKLGVFTIMAPPPRNVHRNSIGWRGARNAQSTALRPVFHTTKDLESNEDNDDCTSAVNEGTNATIKNNRNLTFKIV